MAPSTPAQVSTPAPSDGIAEVRAPQVEERDLFSCLELPSRYTVIPVNPIVFAGSDSVTPSSRTSTTAQLLLQQPVLQQWMSVISSRILQKTPSMLIVGRNVGADGDPGPRIYVIQLGHLQQNQIDTFETSKPLLIMAPSGLAILLGAGPATGAGIARVLANPSQGNMAVALLARRPEALNDLKQSINSSLSNSVIEVFPTDTSPDSLKKAFADIKQHQSFSNLKLRVAIYNVKHSHKTPFMEENYEQFTQSLETYVGGAFTFSQESLKRFFADHGEASLADGSPKKGTLIFTGTLGSLRCNSGYAAYGSNRASVRQLAQSLAREFSAQGVHVAHVIGNGKIEDANGEDQKSGKAISAEAVGKTYLWLAEQEPTLWTHELDMRPAQEKF